MSVENIVKKILDEAQTDARSIAQKAEREAARLSAQRNREETEIREAATKKIEIEAQEIVKRRASSARLEGRKRILGEKDMIVGEVYAEVKERILSLPEDSYLDFLKRLAINYCAGGDERIMLSAKDIVRFKGKLAQWEKDVARATQEQGKKGTITVSSVTRNIEGGLVLSRERTEVNLDITLILNETRYDLEGEVTNILFGRLSR
jgi:V/A-type H+/Na+-transporting ATPase subunit E